MFAGVLNGRLVAGGGSQFHDKPLWLKGTKVFSDRIFVLSDPAGTWTAQEVRLPFKAGHYAAAYTAGAIYVAGGLDQTGCINQAWEIRAQGDGFAFTRLPDLPKTVAYAAGVIAGGRFYVLGGQDALTVRVASVEVWSLGLNEKSAWRREPDLHGAGVFLAAGATQDDAVYLFGGMHFDAAGKAVPSAQALRLDLPAKKWVRLADLPAARVATATPCPLIDGGKAFLIGGYDQSFPGAPRDHPGFPSRTLVYDLARQSSVDGPPLPKREVSDRDLPSDIGPAPMVAAPAVLWRSLAVVISGEVRASVRSPAVVAWPLDISPLASRRLP